MMFLIATDWSTISSLATAGATFVLAVATFASVRSSSRSARIAEAALQEQRRPVLAPSRLDDPVQKIMFIEGHWVSAAGGRAAVEHLDGAVYLGISLKNVGSGIAVCQGWMVRPGLSTSRTMPTHAPVEDFRLQSRDLYISSGDIGMWQGALRNPNDPVRAEVINALESEQPISVELLYSDQVGAQRAITRFGLVPTRDTWLATTTRHWYLDWDGPRPERDALAAGAAVLSDKQAAAERQAAAESEAATAAGADRAPDAEAALPAAGADGAAAAEGGRPQTQRADPTAS